MSENSNIQNSLFEAMKIFSESATANSNATITVEGKVTAIVDEAAGIYSVEYLGSTFDVHANSSATYSVGDSVYILVPDGDFTKEKIILGTISASASVYTNDIENGSNYYDISDNLIDIDSGIIKLSSYGTINKGDNKTNITSQEAEVFGKLINGYLNDYRTFKLGVSVKTSLEVDQQNKGNYGICLNIPIKETAASGGGSQNETWKTIYLETANFVGTPYRYLVWTPQEVYFTIDEQYEYDSSRLPYYSYFCYDFTQDPNKTNILDIQLKDITLKVVNEMTTDETTGYSLFLKASEGEYYSTFYKNTKTITPTIKVNGKTTTLKDAAIYWFIEDTEVKADSEYYSTYGGYGWKCLNTKTNVAYNEDGTQTYNWITTVQNHEVDRSEVRAATRFKCTVAYSGKVLSAIITLKNLSVQESITLTSTKNLTTNEDQTTISQSQDNTYMKDTGYVNLSAIVYYAGVTEKEANRNNITYSWARYDKDGNYINDANDFFTSVVSNKLTKIDGKICYVTQVSFPTNSVEQLNTIYCTAKYSYVDSSSNRYEEQIGTAKIGIATSTEYDLNLNINGDNVIYKYDTDGDSPMGSAYDGPSTSKVTEIAPLTFTVTRADGTELTDDEYKFVKCTWKMPKSSISLFSLGAGTAATREDNNYYYFEGYGKNFNLLYKIASRFNISKIKQAINLTITFQDITLEKSANISFIKEGMGGSNGTAYSALLVSGGMSSTDSASAAYGTLNSQGVAQKLKFLYNINNGILYRHDYNSNELINWNSSQKRIYPQVYRDSTLLDYGTHYDIEYSMFDENTTNPCFNVNKQNDGSCLLSLKSTPSADNCNIVQAKVTVNDGNGSTASAQQVIYTYYPIEITITDFTSSLVPSMDGGFAEVMYASDGTNPSYDETDNFKINDDKVLQISEDTDLNYYNITWESQNHLGIYNVTSEGTTTGTKQTQIVGKATTVKVKPDNKYDDGNSKNYVRATLIFDSSRESELATEKAKCINDRDVASRALIQEQNNFTNLKNCVILYNEKVNNWYSIIENIKSLLSKETNAEYALEKILDIADETLNYINLQEKYNESSAAIASAVKDIKQKFNALKEKTEQAQIKLKALNSLSDLISLNEYRIEITASEIETLKNSIGQEITNVLVIDIDRVNEQITSYQSSYSTLQSDFYKAQLNNYNQIKNDIQSVAAQIPASAFERYVNFKNLILSILSAFDDGVSYDYMKKRLQELENLFYSIAIVNSDHTLTLRESIVNEYNTIIGEYQSTINTNNNRITCINNIISTKDHTIVHVRPIVLYFNRYEKSNINAWDGNKIESGDGTYLLAPQVGAGIKNSDNSFTGIMMGLRSTTSSVSSSNTKQTGLFGYANGKQSLFLSAETGASIFGIAGSGGQIIIDPSSRNGSSGAIYSSNYFNADGYDKTTGLPKDITRNLSGNGMIINFSEPSIKYGSGYFTVDSNGNLHAGGGGDGDVGGWSITNTTLQSNNYKASKNGICLDAANDQIVFGNSNGKIFSGRHTELSNTQDGFYLSQDGLSIGSKTKVTSDGTMYLGDGAVNGTSKHWEINGGNGNSYIKYGNSGSSNSVYLGTEKLTLGSKFYVNPADGSMRLGNGAVNNSGRHWTIDTNSGESYIAYGTDSFDDDSGVYVGTDGIRLGDNFSVDDGGSIQSTDGKIGGWSIDHSTLTGGNTTLNSNGTITCSTLYANNKGSIGGWTIGSSTLTGGNTTLNSNGTITCNQLIANTSGSIGGWNINSNSLSTSSGGGLTLGTNGITGLHFSLNSSGLSFNSGGTGINSSGTSFTGSRTTVDSKALPTYIKDLAVESLNVSDELVFQGYSVKWQSVKVITKRKMEWSHKSYSFVTDVSWNEEEEDVEVDRCGEHDFVFDLTSTSYYRNLFILTNKGEEKEEGGDAN